MRLLWPSGGRLGGPGPTGDSLHTCLATWPQVPPCSPGELLLFQSGWGVLILSHHGEDSSCWQRKRLHCMWVARIAVFCHDRLFLLQAHPAGGQRGKGRIQPTFRISPVTLDGTRAPHRLRQDPAGQKVPQTWKF